MRNSLERGGDLRNGIRTARLNINNLSSGLSAFLFSITGPILIAASLFNELGLPEEKLVAFVMVGQGFAALLTIFMTLRFQIPIILTPPITSFFLISTSYGLYNPSEIAFGILMCGVVVMLLGGSGVLSKVRKHLPLPIVAGMVAGTMMEHGIKIVSATKDAPAVCGSIIAVFCITPLLTKKIPSQLTAVIAAAILAAFSMEAIDAETFGVIAPELSLPEFSLKSFAICIPLVFVILSDTVTGIGILDANGYDAPVNRILLFYGIGTVVSSMALCPAVSLAGVGTAVTATPNAGEKRTRFVAALVKAVLSLVLALLSPAVLKFLTLLSGYVTDLLAGLMLAEMLIRSLRLAFGGDTFHYGAFAALIVGLFQLQIGGVGSGLLALAIGLIVSICLDNQDFKNRKASSSTRIS